MSAAARLFQLRGALGPSSARLPKGSQAIFFPCPGFRFLICNKQGSHQPRLLCRGMDLQVLRKQPSAIDTRGCFMRPEQGQGSGHGGPGVEPQRGCPMNSPQPTPYSLLEPAGEVSRGHGMRS